jgi:cytochrome c oxidase assembly factor CtaG
MPQNLFELLQSGSQRQPYLLFLVLGLSFLWGWGHFHDLKSRSWKAQQGRILQSALALVSLCFLLLGPIHVWANSVSITMRMFEGLILSLWVAPLLLAGLPLVWRDSVLYPFGLNNPVFNLILGNLLFAIWFWPVFQVWDATTLLGDTLAVLLSLVGGLLIWLPLSPLTHNRLTCPQQLFYLLGQVAIHVPLFVFLTFTPSLLYPGFEPESWRISLSALEDQQLAGWMFKLSWTCMSLVLAGKVFLDWGRLRQIQDQLQNQTMYQHLAFLKDAPKRVG